MLTVTVGGSGFQHGLCAFGSNTGKVLRIHLSFLYCRRLLVATIVWLFDRGSVNFNRREHDGFRKKEGQQEIQGKEKKEIQEKEGER